MRSSSGAYRADEPARQHAQQGGLAALRVREADQVRVRAAGRPRPGRGPPRRRRSECRPAASGTVHGDRGDVVDVHQLRQHRDRGERRAGPRRGDGGHQAARVASPPPVPGRQPRGRQHHRRPVRRQPVPRPCGHRGGPAPVHLGLARLAQPQLEAAAEEVLERRPQLAPPVRRHHQVQAVREPLRGERQQPGLQVVELAAQHEVAVDHEQDVRGGLVGKLARRSAGPELLDRSDTRRSGTAAPAGPARPPPRRRPGARRPAAGGPSTVPTCGRPASTASPPPPKSRTCTPSSAGPVGEREGQQHRPQRAGLARPRPADHGEVTRGVREVDVSGSRRCRYGRSTTPTGTRSVPPGAGHRETPSGPDGGHAEQLVEGRGRVQRGQPHAMRGRSRARPSPRSSCRAPWAPSGIASERRRRASAADPTGPARKRWAPARCRRCRARRSGARPGRPRSGRRRTRPGTAPAHRCPWRGRPSRARAATGGRPAPPAPRATRQRRRCAARSDRTGASRARAAGPRRAAARRAAGGCRASGPAARSCPAGRRARAAGRAARRTRRRRRAAPAARAAHGPAVRRAAAYSAMPVRLPAARSSSWRRVISPASASAMRSTRCSSSARLVITAETCGKPRGRGRWRRP